MKMDRIWLNLRTIKLIGLKKKELYYALKSLFSKYRLLICLVLLQVQQIFSILKKILQQKLSQQIKKTMQNFIKLQTVLNDPKKTFDDFKSELIQCDITQFTYICLLLNIAATIRRPDFNFYPYMDLLTNFKNQSNYRSNCINYTGYKDKISILMNACEKSVSTTVAILANHPDIKLHAMDPNGMNAVFYAIKNPDENQGLKIMEFLCELSPQMIDTVINNGYSPLFLAVEKFKVKIVDFLLRNHADPNQKLISSGNTAMHQLAKISSKYSLQEVKKMIWVFLRHDFDLSTRNNQQKTVEEFALDQRFNITELIRQAKFNKRAYSQFCCEQSQTEAYSSKIATSKVEDIFTQYNYSQLEGSIEFNHNQIDSISVTNKSLLSQEINHIRYNDQRQLSLDMNVNQSQHNDDYTGTEVDEMFDKKIECHSHSDSPKSDFQSNDNDKGKYFYQREQSNSELSCSSQESDPEQGDSLKTQLINFEKIHGQILQFDEISQGTYISAWQQIQSFFIKLHQVTETIGLTIEIIGSFATGLWTHLSDIDIALVAQTENFVDFEKLLEKVFNKIKVRMYTMGIKQLSYNKASKIPSIKIEMEPVLFSSRKIDIMIFHKKNMGITYVNYIRNALTLYGQIRPIFFFLKRVCQEFGLHDPFNGGMKSYTIFLMVYSMVNSLEIENLAQIMLKISLYYGFYHDYDYQIQYRNTMDGGFEYFPVPRLNIADPLNTKNNMGGKNTDVYRLKNMFRTIYYGLHRKISQGTSLQHILEMARIQSLKFGLQNDIDRSHEANPTVLQFILIFGFLYKFFFI